MRLLPMTLTTLMLLLVLAGCSPRQSTPATPAAIPTEAGAPVAPEATAPAAIEQPEEPYPPPDVVATPAGAYPAPEEAAPAGGENYPAPEATPTR